MIRRQSLGSHFKKSGPVSHNELVVNLSALQPRYRISVGFNFVGAWFQLETDVC